jgi:hypothetical protein
MVRCSSCGKDYEVSLDFYAPGEVRVASCRACPVDNIYSICEKCENLNNVEMDSCPGCGAWNMWEIRKMVPVDY